MSAVGDFSDLSALDVDSVSGWVGARFSVAEVDGLVLVLARARDLRGPDPAPGFQAFALDFEGPAGQPLDQGTYGLATESGDVDPAPVFIVPVGERDGVRTYEATFSFTSFPDPAPS